MSEPQLLEQLRQLSRTDQLQMMRFLISELATVDRTLIEEALALSDRVNESQLIEDALREYIQRRKQQQIFELFGAIDYEEGYDYKQQRQVT